MPETTRITDLRKKLEKDPGSRLFAQLAEELRKEGQYDEAITVARRGLEKNPNYPSARLTLARALLDAGQPGEARSELEQIVKASPDNILAGRLLGDAMEELGDVSQAIQQFERTLVFSPGDKAMIDKVTLLKARLEAEASAPAAPPDEVLAVEAGSTPPSIFPDQPPIASESPSPFAEPPSLFAEPPSLFADPEPAPAPQPVQEVVAAVAFDRDLASGTISPGSLSVAELQKHFEAMAAGAPDGAALRQPEPAAAAAAAAADDVYEDDAYKVEQTLGFSQAELSAPPPSPAETEPPEPEPSALETDFETPEPEVSALEPEGTAPPADVSSAGDVQGDSSELPPEEFTGDATLPLTSLTLADLYLQQGLKAEANAVLSRVIQDEPENIQARSRFAAVSEELTHPESEEQIAESAPTLEASRPGPAGAEPEFGSEVQAEVRGLPPLIPKAASPRPAPDELAAVSPPLSRAEIRERTIVSLKTFQDAAQREAVHQRASEFSIR